MAERVTKSRLLFEVDILNGLVEQLAPGTRFGIERAYGQPRLIRYAGAGIADVSPRMTCGDLYRTLLVANDILNTLVRNQRGE